MACVEIALVLASVAFALFVIWRFRPQLGGEREIPISKKLNQKLEQASGAAEKAEILYAAGESSLRALRVGHAEAYFRRALRLQPNSAELLTRVMAALQRWPRARENLLWRKLADQPMGGEGQAAALVALRALHDTYLARGRLRPRARALAHVLAALGAPVPEDVSQSIEMHS